MDRTYKEREVLQTWDQAGERPWDYLIELGLDSILTNMLANPDEINEQYLYRGTTRNLDLQVDDIKNYTYPSSWSTSPVTAGYFIDGVSGVVFVLDCSQFMPVGIYNTENSYDEKEVILAPVKLVVEKREVAEDVTYIHMRKL